MFFKANFRKATLAIIIGMAAILPIHAFAIGLGEIQLNSSLNEPLNAEIQLLQVKGLSASDIIVGIAPKADFEAAGVDRLFFLSSLKFSLELGNPKGPVVRISTDAPVREPYLNFLLQVQWPSGRLLREYTLLMDISSLSDSHASARAIKGTEAPAPTAEIAKPTAAMAPMDVAALEAELAEVEAQSIAAPVAAAPVATQTPDVAAAGSDSATTAEPAAAASAEPATAEEAVEAQPAAPEETPVPAPVEEPAPTAAASQASTEQAAVLPVYASTSTEGDYTVQKGDNLWSIAMKYRQADTVSVQQSMLAIQQLNPGAFSQGNINLLKKGKVLRLPSYDDLTEMTSREAVVEVRRQNVAWSGNADGRKAPAVAEQIDATYQEGAADTAAVDAEAGHLKLSVPGSAESSAAGKASGAAAGSTEALQNELSIAMEELDRNKREKTVTAEQVAGLNDQANTMQQMLDVRSAELAALQAALAAKNQAPAVAPDAAVVAPDGSAVDAQPAPEVTPAIAPAASTDDAASAEQAPEPAVEETAAPSGGLLDTLMANLVWIGGGLLTLLLLVFAAIKLRNRTQKKNNFASDEEDADEDGHADLLDLHSHDDDDDETADSQLDSFEMDDDVYQESTVEAKPETSDALGEADIYISFGTYDKAESLLKNAISSEPKRTDLRLKLLEVYVGMENLKGFDKQLEELNKLGDRGAIERAREMRNRISGASDNMSNAPTALTAALPSEDNLDFDLDLSEDISAESTSDLGLDFDLDFDLDEPKTDSTQKSPKVNMSDAPTVQQRAIDISEMKTAMTPAVKAAEAHTATRESIDLDLAALDAELEAFDAIPDTASSAAYEAVANDAPTPKTSLDEEFDFLADADEAATKLDLARAYIDMGDKDGAKDILEEVIEEGQDAQKAEARKLLAGIS